MIQTLINAWKIMEIRKKLLFTALIIFIFRVGAAVPVPFVSIGEGGILAGQENAGTFMNYLSMMTGNAFNYGTIFAMSITPYINASIIMQLLTVAIPYLERLQKEGEVGRKKIAAITRYLTVVLGLMQSTAYYSTCATVAFCHKMQTEKRLQAVGRFSRLLLLSCALQQELRLSCGSANKLTIKALEMVFPSSFLPVSFQECRH